MRLELRTMAVFTKISVQVTGGDSVSNNPTVHGNFRWEEAAQPKTDELMPGSLPV